MQRLLVHTERLLILILVLLLLPLVGGTGTQPLSSGDGTALVRAVQAVGLTVSNMDRSIDFYSNIRAFEKVSDEEVTGEAYERLQGVFALRMRVVRMRLGDETLELTEYIAPRGRPAPTDSRSNDRWFQHVAIIVSNMDKAYGVLRRHRVAHISPGPQRLPDWNPKAGGIRAFYFRDPDGHPLEILWFPPGKGDPKWRRFGNQLFLGIDHTAIGVGNTKTSLRFYRDLLGMQVVGESENYSPEQERLNSVFGARLRITGLRATAGPGIEFLEYLSPRDGRPYPFDERANDLVHWQTHLATPDPEAVWERLRGARTLFISPGVVDLPESRTPRKALAIRDPDGHAIVLSAR
jgi:catechol 2,3-dioxygenase-like lactoylglutathione lyase family enzyme